MFFLRVILGALFLATVIGIVLAVLLASNYREQALLFFNALKSGSLHFIRKRQMLFRLRNPV
jgi:hypothetical protein